MASKFDFMVPSDKQVSLVLPLTVVGVCSVIQLILGASPAIIAMCAIAIIVPFLPFVVYGRDLYSVLGVGFSLTYVGIALVTKTFYGQTLELESLRPLRRLWTDHVADGGPDSHAGDGPILGSGQKLVFVSDRFTEFAALVADLYRPRLVGAIVVAQEVRSDASWLLCNLIKFSICPRAQ